jgi:hypothetical protein
MTQKIPTEDRVPFDSNLSSGFFLEHFFHQPKWTRTWQVGLLVAFVGTVAYNLPLVGALLPGHAHWPGFMLTGDQRMFYFPSFVEGYRRFWHGGLLGIDFLVNDGASVFAYRPNMMPFYPPYIIAYILADCSNLRTAMLAYTIINILHHFAGTFFSFIFVRRYLGFPTASAVLATAIYTLSWYTGALSGEETFYLQMMLLPVAACAICWLMQTRLWLAPIWVSPLFVTIVLSNYGPTMLATMGLSVVAGLLAYGLWIDGPERRRPQVVIAPLASMTLAAVVCLPYIVAQFQFKNIMSPTADDIDPVAHDLALKGFDAMNAFSQYLDFRRTHFEEILLWGLIPTFICLFGLTVLIKRRDEIKPRYLWACGVSAIVYLFVLLPTFGASLLPAADAFYYAVPILGRMHIFQRTLAFAQFFFAIMVSGMATITVTYASQNAKRASVYVAVGIWLVASAALMIWSPSPTDVNGLLVELFLMVVAAVALAVGRLTPAIFVVSVLTAVIGLNLAYAIPLSTNRITQWSQEPDPLGPETGSMIAFIKANDGGKALSKIAIASADILPYLNRNWPWLVGKDVKVMNYQGYPPHLTNLADYSATQFGPYGVFDISWLKATGLDFVFWSDATGGPLGAFTGAGYGIGPVLDLPGGNHLGKVSLPTQADQAPVGLNLSPTTVAQWPKPITMDRWSVTNGVLVKAKDGQQSQFGYPIGTKPGLAYQVDFDAEATTPGQVRVALAGQVLDVVNVTGKIHFSKRLNATAIGDLWILGSPTFSGALSNIVVQTLAPVAPHVIFDNGIFRYTGAPGAVKSFKTNYTTRAQMMIDSPTGGTVTYLLWPNPHMAPFIDGQQSAWANPGERPLKVRIGPGRHRFEMRFMSRAGALFYCTMILYLMLLAAAVVGRSALPNIAQYRERLQRSWKGGSNGGRPAAVSDTEPTV